MKAGLTTSVVLHAAILGFGLVSLSSPKPLDAGMSEALPVDIVPVSEFAEMVEGDKTAAINETPAPKPTEKPPVMLDAVNAGDNSADLETPPTPEARPQEVKVASAPPPPPPEPVAKPEPAPPKPLEPTPEPVKAPEPAPKPPVEEAKAEPAPPPEPKPEAEPLEQAEPKPPEPEKKPESKPETKPVETAEAKPEPDQVKLPDSAPSPLARPQAEQKPAETKVADASEAKPEKTKKDSTAKASADSGEALEDQVAMLLNKQKASGGGAKRSQAQKASVGNSKTTGAKLSQSEMDALSGQLAGCWSIPAGAEGLEGMRVSVRFHLDAAGQLEGAPSIDTSSGDRSFDQSAVRAVQKCNRQGFTLPKDKADTWAEVVVNFDPSAMF